MPVPASLLLASCEARSAARWTVAGADEPGVLLFRECGYAQPVAAGRIWRDARRMSSTVPRPAFVSARVRGASAVVVTHSVRKRKLHGLARTVARVLLVRGTGSLRLSRRSPPLGIAGVHLRHLLSAIGQLAATAPVSRRLLKSRQGSRVTRSGTRINAMSTTWSPRTWWRSPSNRWPWPRCRWRGRTGSRGSPRSRRAAARRHAGARRRDRWATSYG